MLERLTLVNFEAHRKITIDFGSATSIIGESDQGKSSIIRGLRWICLNQPGGSSGIIHHGKSFAKGVLVVDGHTITRYRSASKNTYQLDDQVFTAFGSKVPEPIENLLRISDLNFQLQRDSHFWISLSPGQVSRELNSIVDLSAIDTSIRAAVNDKKKLEVAKELITERIDEAKIKLRKVRRAPVLLKQLRRLDAQKSRLEEKRADIDSLASILDKGSPLADAAAIASQLKSEGRELKKRIAQASQKKKDLEFLRGLIKIADQNRMPSPPSFTEVERLKKSIDRKQETLVSLRKMIDRGWESYGTYTLNDSLHKQLSEKLGVCPTCQRPLQS